MDQKICTLLAENGICFRQQALMAEYTTFHTGGPADLIVFPKDEAQLAFCLGLFADQYIVLGNCSNILVSDRGIDGAVIFLGKNFSRISIQNYHVNVQAGAKLSTLCNTAIEAGLIGLEFASGIPGTVGGGIYMNAGAYGEELLDFVQSVQAMDSHGKIKTFYTSELKPGYRSSVFMKNGFIVLSAVFALKYGDRFLAKQRIRELASARRNKQPLEYPSAGSIFKRPVGNYAGTLIEQCGLKGFRIGGAEVSQKHAGFIVNIGGATTDDILELISYVQNCVQQKTGIFLEPEVRFVGRL